MQENVCLNLDIKEKNISVFECYSPSIILKALSVIKQFDGKGDSQIFDGASNFEGIRQGIS